MVKMMIFDEFFFFQKFRKLGQRTNETNPLDFEFVDKIRFFGADVFLCVRGQPPPKDAQGMGMASQVPRHGN